MVTSKNKYFGIDIGTTMVVVSEPKESQDEQIVSRFPVVLNVDTGATGHEATEETTSTQDRIDTLNLREKELCASVRDLCKAMRDDGVLSRVKAEERSYARVLRANQWFVHSLLALVRAEVTKRRELPHFLMEDVVGMLHLSRNLFFPMN